MVIRKRSYHELVELPDFPSRVDYLRLNGMPFGATFGEDRYFNQQFYTSYEWRIVKRDAIVRDNGWDLGIVGLPIDGKVFVHHIIPITMDMIKRGDTLLLDPDNLICCSYETHRIIHYGNSVQRAEVPERYMNDTCPWKTDSSNAAEEVNKCIIRSCSTSRSLSEPLMDTTFSIPILSRT